MSDKIQDLIKAIPGLGLEISNLLSCRLSGPASYHINENTFQLLRRQLSAAFLENTDPSKFLAGIGIRLTMSTLTIVSTVNFQNTYCVMQDLHHTVRGTNIPELSVMGVLVKLAAYAVKEPNCASKESQEFIKVCLARLVIPDTFAPVCTATEHIWNYGNRRLSGASHEVACGLVLPRQVQAAFFLQDLHLFLDELRTAYLIGFQSDQSSLCNILLILIQAFPTLTDEWLSNEPDLMQFEQSWQLHSLFGVLHMLLGHFQKGNPDSFDSTICHVVNNLNSVLYKITTELGIAVPNGKLQWEGPINACTVFGPYLDKLREQLMRLKRQAGCVGQSPTPVY